MTATRVRGPARVLATLMLAAGVVAAATAGADPPTRAQTLGEDLSGPRLNVMGTVADILQDGGDTCFVLELGGGGGWGPGGGRLLACYPGPFDGARFGIGQALRVRGSLGAATPRSVGGRVVDYPVAAGAFISPAAPKYGWPAAPSYESFVPPYASSWPWPGYGIWYGSGWYRPGWGIWMGR